jgi:predicted dehydrogenase
MLRGALIGFGNVAANGHVPGWLARPDVEIVAVSDSNNARRSEAARLLPHAHWYQSGEALLAKERLDFVDICTPPSSHANLIRMALKQGLHVLCEKPLVTRPEDLAELSMLAGSARRVLYTVHNWHHAPIIEFVRDLLQRREIGSITSCAWQTLRMKPAAAVDGQSGNWRLDPHIAGGGVLVDHGWHACYVILNWLEQRPTAISAKLETRRHVDSPLEDTATVHIQFPRATVELFLTWAADERRNTIEITGDRGTIRVENKSVLLSLVGSREGGSRWELASGLSEGSHHPEWFGGVVSGFLAEIADDTIRGRNFTEAALCVDMLALAQLSSREEGAWLPIADPVMVEKTDIGAP